MPCSGTASHRMLIWPARRRDTPSSPARRGLRDRREARETDQAVRAPKFVYATSRLPSPRSAALLAGIGPQDDRVAFGGQHGPRTGIGRRGLGATVGPGL